MREFRYQVSKDYDKKVKIRKQEIDCYSPKKLDEIVGDRDYNVPGYLRSKKRKSTIAGIDVNDNTFYVERLKNRVPLFTRIAGYVQVDKLKFLALVKLNIIFILIFGLLLAGIGVWFIGSRFGFSPNARKLTGKVTVDGRAASGIELTLKEGNKTIAFGRTGGNGSYKLSGIPEGIYTLEYTDGNSIMTTMVEIDGVGNSADLKLPKSTVKARIVYRNETTAPIAVGGFDKYAASLAEEGKEVSVTLYAEQVKYNQSEAHRAIKMAAEDKDLVYFNFYILVEVSEDGILLSREKVTELPEYFTVVIKTDGRSKDGVTVYRYTEDGVQTFLWSSLSSNRNRSDGIFDYSENYVKVYTEQLTTFALGYAGGSSGSGLGYDTEQGTGVITEPPETDGKPNIVMPGFTRMTLKANQTEQTAGYNFFNPQANAGWYDMTFELRIDRNGDGELTTYYVSGLVTPGNKVLKMTLNKPLPPGEYDGVVFVQPYLYGDTAYPLNNGSIAVTITVQ